jgi:hypothetical protein
MTLFCLNPIYPQQSFNLEEISIPHCLSVFKDHIYILENGTVYVYEISEAKLVRKFGKRGEGPGETQNFPVRGNMLFVNYRGVYIDARNKIVLFSHHGQLVKEYKKPYEHFYVKPFQNLWITLYRFPSKKGFNLGVSLCDSKFNVQKRLGSKSIINNKGEFDLMPDAFNFCVGKDVFFIEFSEEDFLIIGYLERGKQAIQIQEKLEKQKVSADDIDFVFEEIKHDPETKLMGGLQAFKKRTKYKIPDHLPIIKNISCDSGILFVKTFIRRDYSHLFYFYKVTGEKLGQAYLPFGVTDNLDDQLTGRLDRYYSFSGDFYYYLQENEEKSIWQIHRINWRNQIFDNNNYK